MDDISPVTIQLCDENIIWVTTDEDPNGIEFSVLPEFTESENFIIALADFFDCDIKEIASKL